MNQKIPPAIRKKVLLEFKAWKAELLNIVKSGSRIVFNPDGTYQFILAPRLVKLVWRTTIQERIKYKLQTDKTGKTTKQAAGEVIATLRDELAGVEKRILAGGNADAEEGRKGDSDAEEIDGLESNGS